MEVFLPGAVAVAVALGMGLWFERPGRRKSRCGWSVRRGARPADRRVRRLASIMPAQHALLGTLGLLDRGADGDVSSLPFFLKGLGIDHPADDIAAMLCGRVCSTRLCSGGRPVRGHAGPAAQCDSKTN